MAFSDYILDANSVGKIWLLDVSFDDFSSIAYQYSTGTYVAGATTWDARITSIGGLDSGFSLDGLPAPATIDLELANVDGNADWLCDRTAAANVNKARFRLTLYLWDTTLTAGAYLSGQTIEPGVEGQQMGVFSMLDWPKRYVDRIKLTLADDAQGKINDGYVAPTIREWVANVVANFPAEVCPIAADTPIGNVDWDVAVPLAFGVPSLKCYAAANQYLANEAQSHLVIPVCATTDTSGTPGVVSGFTKLDIAYRTDIENPEYLGDLVGARLGIPRSWTYVADAGTPYATPVSVPIWSAYLSNTIVKNGVAWRIYWVQLDMQAYVGWFQRTFKIVGAPPANVANTGNTPPVFWLYPTAKGSGLGWAGGHPTGMSFTASTSGAAESFYVSATPLSARTVQNSLMQNASDIIFDLLTYYSAVGSSTDATSFAKAKAATSALFVGGVINPFPPPQNGLIDASFQGHPFVFQPGVLRKALQDICASADLDLYVRRIDNKFALACSFFTFDDITATHRDMPETRTSDVEESRPSVGARWYPYNRVYLTAPDNSTLGPFDNPAGLTTLGGVPCAKTINAKWMILVGSAFSADYLLGIWGLRNLETVVRPTVRFRADKSALALDLASFFTFNWSRGTLGGPYSAAVFRVERMVIDPDNLTADIEAVWVDDIATERSYLLDDETLIVVATGSGGRTVGVTDSSATFAFSSGSLVSDGVAAGDIVLLQDGSESDEGYTRNRALRVASITNATHLVVAGSDLDFGGGATVSNWKILKGATHYPTVGTDPSNYPSGSTMYGKASDNSSLYSDSSAANLLKEG